MAAQAEQKNATANTALGDNWLPAPSRNDSFDYSEEMKGAKNSRNWHRYRCASCGDEFIIPGLSLDG